MQGDSTLVTGGAGFVGLALMEHLLGQGEDVTVLDVIDVPPDALEIFSRLPGRLRAVRGSVLDPATLREALAESGAPVIVHAATVTPDAAREKVDPVTVNEVNFIGTLRVLEAVRERGLRLIHLSTSGVYGDIQNRPGFGTLPVGEDALPGPVSFYAVSKTAAEQMVARYVALFGLDAVIARVGVTWGPWEYDTGLRHVFSAPLQLLRLAHAGTNAVISRESIKDWSYSRDVARGVALLKDTRGRLNSRLFNVSGDTMWAVTAFAERLAREFPGFGFRVAPTVDDPAVNVTLSKASDRQGLDVTRLKRETGYVPAFDADAAFGDYIAWAARTHCWREPREPLMR